MRQFRKNTQSMKYALQIAEIPELEMYEDEDGNRYPMGAKPNGKTEIVYGEPIDFRAIISMSGGEAEAVEYGLSTADYAAVMLLPLNSVPLKEGALIWHKSEPTFKHIDLDVEIDDVEIDDVAITLNGNYPIKTSADFVVMKLSPSLNVMKVILQAVNK